MQAESPLCVITSASSLSLETSPEETESPLQAVQAYIGSDSGVSLKATNGKYLSRINRWYRDAVEAAKDKKDPLTHFKASAMNGKLVLKADNGKYLSRIYRFYTHYLEAAKDEPDVFCQFRVVPAGNGLIALQGDNGLYVSRILRCCNISSIEVSKDNIDEECMFMPEDGTE